MDGNNISNFSKNQYITLKSKKKHEAIYNSLCLAAARSANMIYGMNMSDC